MGTESLTGEVLAALGSPGGFGDDFSQPVNSRTKQPAETQEKQAAKARITLLPNFFHCASASLRLCVKAWQRSDAKAQGRKDARMQSAANQPPNMKRSELRIGRRHVV